MSNFADTQSAINTLLATLEELGETRLENVANVLSVVAREAQEVHEEFSYLEGDLQELEAYEYFGDVQEVEAKLETLDEYIEIGDLDDLVNIKEELEDMAEQRDDAREERDHAFAELAEIKQNGEVGDDKARIEEQEAIIEKLKRELKTIYMVAGRALV